MKSNYNSHVWRIVLGLAVLSVGVVLWFGVVKNRVITSFGKYGHYRADAIEEEANREIRFMTNAPCFSCHAYETKLHDNGRHKTISCEFCHGPMADHVKDNKKIGELPVKKGEEIRVLCLRCHNQAIRARPKDVIKTVVMPDHLRDQKVKETHTCNQCHLVHAPFNYIDHANKIFGIQEKN